MNVSIEKKGTVWDSLSNILFFPLSDKLKFSIKVSLSMALAFLIPFAMGWSHASTAATTVMIIAAMGSVNESINKGAMRVYRYSDRCGHRYNTHCHFPSRQNALSSLSIDNSNDNTLSDACV